MHSTAVARRSSSKVRVRYDRTVKMSRPKMHAATPTDVLGSFTIPDYAWVQSSGSQNNCTTRSLHLFMFTCRNWCRF